MNSETLSTSHHLIVLERYKIPSIMKSALLFLLIFLMFGCNNQGTTTTEQVNQDTIAIDATDDPKQEIDTVTSGVGKVYSNERFKDVTVTKTGENTFQITGKGQIFEANFGWVIEDGHDELQTGHHMTDAGAPEWGNFNFTVTAPKKDPNTTLHLVLFESSAKDGSRQHELPILLY